MLGLKTCPLRLPHAQHRKRFRDMAGSGPKTGIAWKATMLDQPRVPESQSSQRAGPEVRDHTTWQASNGGSWQRLTLAF